MRDVTCPTQGIFVEEISGRNEETLHQNAAGEYYGTGQLRAQYHTHTLTKTSRAQNRYVRLVLKSIDKLAEAILL